MLFTKFINIGYFPLIPAILLRGLGFIVFLLAKLYVLTYWWALDRFGRAIPGAGRALRSLRSDREISVGQYRFHLNRNLAPAYFGLIAGRWAEPETHKFLDGIARKIDFPLSFVNVGGNIGEFAVTVCSNNREFIRADIFEPISECCAAIERSLKLNEVSNYTIHNCAVGSKSGEVEFSQDKNPQNSSVVSPSGKSPTPLNVYKVPIKPLDSILDRKCMDSIFLVDVEGFEVEVLKGALEFINQTLPIIIFEYNSTSHRVFTLQEVASLLPDEYQIFRLRDDGNLDREVENSWNCVAVSEKWVGRLASYGITFH